ncbi:MAG: YfcE family phosphodiesterase [Saccharofermentans sp.]|nr:YfcE family phosphodiesterase [Saccharofermentans sp.]
MTRYLICSDIHGRKDLFDRITDVEKNLSAVIIAGDLELDVSELSDIVMRKNTTPCSIYAVAGNCDAYRPSKVKLREVLTFDIGDEHRAFLTHGHRYGAREDLMSYAALENNCNIVIFGHTHCFCEEEQFGTLFLNPGALKAGSYMILEEDEGHIRVFHKRV